MTVQVNPVGCSHGDISIQGILIAVFNDVEVLNPKTLAGAHNRAGIVWLKDILENNANMAGSSLNNRLHASPLFRGHKLQKVLNEGRFCFGVKGVQLSIRQGVGLTKGQRDLLCAFDGLIILNIT